MKQFINNKPCQFSLFENNIYNKFARREPANLEEIACRISSTELAVQTHRIRQAQSKAERSRLKAHLPNCTFSGYMAQRNSAHFVDHSGLICIDIDHQDSLTDAAALRSQLFADPILAPALAFVSPSGEGVKLVMRIEANQASHKVQFDAISNYVRATYGLEVDKCCADVTRACYLCHDPGVLYDARRADAVPDRGPFTSTWGTPFLALHASRPSLPPATAQAHVHYVAPPQFATAHATSPFRHARSLSALYYEATNERVERAVRYLEQIHSQVADDYLQWCKIGFALASEFGESGYYYYRRISLLNAAKFNETECYRKYLSLCQTKNFSVSIGTFFHIVKGIRS